MLSNCLRCLGVIERAVVARHGRADRAPADAVARLVQAGERAFQSCNAGQQIFGGDFAVGHRQARGDGGAQRIFAVHVPGFESGRALFHEEAANFVVFHFAHTTATSAIEPLVIHIFSPFRM